MNKSIAHEKKLEAEFDSKHENPEPNANRSRDTRNFPLNRRKGRGLENRSQSEGSFIHNFQSFMAISDTNTHDWANIKNLSPSHPNTEGSSNLQNK